MGRASRIDDQAVFAAVARAMASGRFRLETVMAEGGLSTGSLYHRFGSREGLLAAAWIDAVTAFQAGFLGALKTEGGEAAALATPRFCRAEPDKALILTVCRRADFLGEATPADLNVRAETINAEAASALRSYAKEAGLSMPRARAAIVGVPLGIVRLYLPAAAVPRSADALVRDAYRGIITQTD